MNDDTMKHGINQGMFDREIDASDGEALVWELDRMIRDLNRYAAENGRRLNWASVRMDLVDSDETNDDGEKLGLKILTVRILSDGVESEL